MTFIFSIPWTWSEHFLVVGFLATWHTLWFRSTLPPTVFRILWTLGWQRDDPYFWNENIDVGMTRKQWVDWWSTILVTYFSGFQYFLGYQLLCPWCVGFHTSWILGSILSAVTGQWQFLIGGLTFYPISVFVLNALSKNE